MADIKTRDTSKGTIKTINKAAVATERMKKAYVMTKDKAEHSTNASENSAEEYACLLYTSVCGRQTVSEPYAFVMWRNNARPLPYA